MQSVEPEASTKSGAAGQQTDRTESSCPPARVAKLVAVRRSHNLGIEPCYKTLNVPEFTRIPEAREETNLMNNYILNLKKNILLI